MGNDIVIRWEIHRVIGSTMERAWELSPGPAIVVSLRQERGYGRTGPWLSPPGGSYFSVIFPTERPLEALPKTAVCTAKYVEGFGLKPGIKWPNDILVEDRKLAGILCEALTHGSSSIVNVGVGLNVVSDPPVEGAISLSSLGVSDVSVLEPAFRIPICVLLEEFDVRGEYLKRLLWIGEEVLLEGHKGKFLGVDGEFRAIVEAGGKSFSFPTGSMRKVK